MSEVSGRDRLLYLSRRYIWWTPADDVVDQDVDRLIQQVMDLGTPEDTDLLFDLFDLARLRSVYNEHGGWLRPVRRALWSELLDVPMQPRAVRQIPVE